MLSFIICHRPEEIELSWWCISNRTGRWVWPCASCPDTAVSPVKPWLLRLRLANKGLPGGYCGVWHPCFPRLMFSLSQWKAIKSQLIFCWGKHLTSIWTPSAFQSVQFVCLNCNYGQQHNSEKLHFLIWSISSGLFDSLEIPRWNSQLSTFLLIN